MTKKFISTVSILAIAIIVVSASLFYLNTYYPPKPKDTNLKFWVGERISKEEREELGFTELERPGLFGGGWYYLDGDYKAKLEYSPIYCNGTVPYKSEPDIYVTYNFDNYPDLASPQVVLNNISFNDPQYYLYGLNINSTREEVDEKLLSIGFEIDYYIITHNVYDYTERVWKQEDEYIHQGRYKKGRLYVSFTEEYVSVGLRSTNKMGIVY